MDVFNIVAGVASIIALLLAIWGVTNYVSKKKKTKIVQTAIGSGNKQSINIKGK